MDWGMENRMVIALVTVSIFVVLPIVSRAQAPSCMWNPFDSGDVKLGPLEMRRLVKQFDQIESQSI